MSGVREDVRASLDAAGAHDHAHQDLQLHVPTLLKGTQETAVRIAVCSDNGSEVAFIWPCQSVDPGLWEPEEQEGGVHATSEPLFGHAQP